MILLISASWVTRIIGMSRHPALPVFLSLTLLTRPGSTYFKSCSFFKPNPKYMMPFVCPSAKNISFFLLNSYNILIIPPYHGYFIFPSLSFLGI
jgi:hypothetical protein